MAFMYPDDIDDFEEATEGEKKVFRFLKEAARPHKDNICWYEPPIGSKGKEPDFILFDRKLGLIVLEVKDWTSKQIIKFNPITFTLRTQGKNEERTNPDKQAKGYVNTLKGLLKKFPEFLTDNPKHKGNPKIPIGRMVVFPNISKKDYVDSKFKWLLDSERFLSKDDLDPAGEFLCDSSGKIFREKISKVVPFPFKGFTEKEIEKLSFLIWPEGKIDLPSRSGSGKSRFQKEVQALDNLQARTALRLGSGHQIIKGPPGSGKTLVLIHRCCHLFNYNPKVKRILLVCYNIALVGYLRRLVQEKGLGIGEDGIDVYHFYELCALVLGEPVHYENEESEYYDLVTQETLETLLDGRSKIDPFDAILLDEGQDFQEDMLMVLLNLLKLGGDFIISLDSYQDLYRRNFSWKSVGIKASGRTRHLKNVYRNTVEIFDSTQRFIGKVPKNEKQESMPSLDIAFHGESPEFYSFKNQEEIENFLIVDLKRCIEEDDYKRSEIAIIYDDKIYGPSRFAYDNRTLPMRILNKLNSSGVPSFWVSQDVRSKEMYDITTDRVSLISIHSSKGLDFDLVYLIGIDHIRALKETKEALDCLVYVAMTRAKYRLVVPYIGETEIIKRMKDSLRR